MSAVATLIDLLAGRRDAAELEPRAWDGVVSVARAEALLGTLAHRLEGAQAPPSIAALTRLVRETPAFAISYPDSAAGMALVEQLWADVSR